MLKDFRGRRLGAAALAAGMVVGLGDSHTDPAAYAERWEYWPEIVGDALGVPSVALGRSGNSSGQGFNRRRETLRRGSVFIAGAYLGTNDINADDATVAASPAPTPSVFSLADDEEYQAAEAWIRVNGTQAQIQSVSGTQVTLTAPLASAPPAGATVLQDTAKNLDEIIAYWQAQGVPHILVLGQHYTNFSQFGDTPTVEVSWAQQLRTIQRAAAEARGVHYVDLYGFMRDLILAGEFVQGSASWHVADLNTHLNAIGQRVLARGVLATIRPLLA